MRATLSVEITALQTGTVLCQWSDIALYCMLFNGIAWMFFRRPRTVCRWFLGHFDVWGKLFCKRLTHTIFGFICHFYVQLKEMSLEFWSKPPLSCFKMGAILSSNFPDSCCSLYSLMSISCSRKRALPKTFSVVLTPELSGLKFKSRNFSLSSLSRREYKLFWEIYLQLGIFFWQYV